MATEVLFRRGTTAEHSAFTGGSGEMTVDTDKDVLVAHDGSTAGGFPMLREDFNNITEDGVLNIRQYSGTDGGELGYLSSSITNGQTNVTSIDITTIDSNIEIEDGIRLHLYDGFGNYQVVNVDGDQDLVQGANSISVNSFTASNEYETGYAYLIQPSYESTSLISISREEVVLKATASSGKISKFANVELRADVAAGSAITVGADLVNIDGTTAFTTGYDPFPAYKLIVSNGFNAAFAFTTNIDISWSQFNITVGDGTSLTISAGSNTGVADATDSYYIDLKEHESGGDPQLGSANYAMQVGTVGLTEPLKIGEVHYGATGSDDPVSSEAPSQGVITGNNLAFETITADKIDVSNLYAKDATITATLLLGTGAEFKSSSTALDGTASSAGILIDDSGVYGAGANQDKTDANVRILATGDAEFTGDFSTADGGITLTNAGGVVIDGTSTGGSQAPTFDIIETVSGDVGVRVRCISNTSAIVSLNGKHVALSASGESGAATTSNADIISYGSNDDARGDGAEPLITANSPIQIQGASTPSTPLSDFYLNGEWRIDATTANSATAGSNGDVPAQVAAYITIDISGTSYKIPYYNT